MGSTHIPSFPHDYILPAHAILSSRVHLSEPPLARLRVSKISSVASNADSPLSAADIQVSRCDYSHVKLGWAVKPVARTSSAST